MIYRKTLKLSMTEKEIIQQKDNHILKLEKEVDKWKKAVKTQRYGLVWLDVPEAFEDDVENKLPILEEVSKNEIKGKDGKPTNILIEGDNYHVLTCLNYTHKEKVDVIYIDPPYNTGSDGFRYKDKRILDKFPDGTEVPVDHPFRHSYWLSFMRKRLELARDLLANTGVIFISIDNNEYSQLKLLCDSIFQEKNCVGTLIWRKKEGGGQADAYFVTEHEYILVYAKSPNFKWLNEVIPTEEADFNKADSGGKFTAVKLAKWGNTARREDRPKMYFSIKAPDGKNVFPIAPDGGDGRWRVGKKRMEELIKKDLIFWQKREGKWVPYEKLYYTEGEVKVLKERSILYELTGTADGTNELTNIFGKKDVFENPKSTELIKFFIKYGAKENAIVLDFFAGSGSTGHAVMKLNEEDGGTRQFLLVTNNEKDIMKDVCYPRLKKVINGYSDEKGLHSSLKYYKTNFVGEHNVLDANDKDKIQLAYHAGEMLAIAENTLDQTEKNNYWQIFESKEKITAIYFREEQEKLDEFVHTVLSLKKPVTVYMFSWEERAEIIDFEDNRNVNIKTIPQPIFEIYKQIYNII